MKADRDALRIPHFYDADAAERVHFANDNERIARLAEAMHRQRGGSVKGWRNMSLDDQRPLRREARDWLRAAVAAWLVAAPPVPDWKAAEDAIAAGAEIDQAVESTGHMPGYDDGGALNDYGRDYAEEDAVRREIEREEAAELAAEQAELLALDGADGAS